MNDGERLQSGLRRAGRVAFGDRVGLVLWLGLVALYAALWRPALALTDSNVFANVLVAMADGSLAVTELRFPLDSLGASHVQQGLRLHDGAYYGRNYGQVALAVPVLWSLEALAAVADPRLLLAGAWSGLLVVLGAQGGIVFGRPQAGRVAGALVGAVAFFASLAVATDLDPRLLPVLALQLVNLVAAAGIGLALYRLVGLFHERRVAVAAGLAAGVATPVAFWATFPKRHVLVAFLLAVGIYCFAASRTRSGSQRWLRAGAYAAVALIAWIHAFEAVVLGLALATVDLTTASRTDARTVALVAVCVLVALAPTLATNAAVSGDPLKPPRLVSTADPSPEAFTSEQPTPASGAGAGESGVEQPAGDGASPAAGGGGSSAGSTSGGGGASDGSPSGGGGPLGGLSTLLGSLVPAAVLRALGVLTTAFGEGLGTLSAPDRLWHTFVRSGNIERLGWTNPGYQPIELSVLESMPLMAGLLGVPLAAAGRVNTALRKRRRPRLRRLSAVRQVDLLVAVAGVLFALAYIHRLPLHSQLTVRYLFPLYPLAVYGVARSVAVREALTGRSRVAVGAATVGILLGTVGAVLTFGAIEPARAEAVQATALVHLAVAGALAAAVIGRALAPERVGPRAVAATLGVATGVPAGYYVLAALSYFTDGAYVLDVTRLLAESVVIL